MPPKRSHLVLCLVTALILLPTVLAAALYCLAQINAKPLAQRFLTEFSTDIACTVTVGEVDIVTLPVPSVIVRSLTVERDGVSIAADSVILRPDFYALFRGEFLPRAVSGTLRASPWLERLDFTADLSKQDATWTVATDIRGHFRKNEALLPFSLRGTAVVELQQARFEITDMRLGDDGGQLSAVLTLPDGTPSPNLPSLQGRLHLDHLSLTRWFGFARNLTPGLQVTLDDITDCALEFTLDTQGLSVPSIAAHAANARFTGSGGVESWTNPTVALNLSAERLRLETGLPEAAAELPQAPIFPHEALTPKPGAPSTPNSISIDYDIRLGARQLDYGPLPLNEALVVIRPGSTDKNGMEDTVLTADSKLYNGTVYGQATLGATLDDRHDITYAITLRLRDIEGVPLVRALPVIPVHSDRFQADCNITSQGRELALFLANLKGNVASKATRGFVRLPKPSTGKNETKHHAFADLDATLALRSAVWENGRLGLNGQWQNTLNTPGVTLRSELSGMVYFGGSSTTGTVDFQNCPGILTLSLQPEQSPFPASMQAKLAGTFSCQSVNSQFSVTDARLNALGIDAQGSVQLSEDKSGFVWQGKLAAKSGNLDDTLRLATGTPLRLPQALRSLTLETAFKGSGQELALSTLRVRFPQTALSGNLLLFWQQQPRLDFDLEADHLNIDAIRGNPLPAASKKPERKSLPAIWDLRFLRTVNAHGELRIARLTAWKLQLHSVKLPISLTNGQLTCPAASAVFYEAPLQGKCTITFAKGLNFKSSFSAENFTLTTASKDRGGNSALGGKATLTATLRGALTGPGQLPAALNGTARFSVKNGSYQKCDDNGTLKGKPTLFSAASASAILTAGVLRGNDFHLQGDGLVIKGGGWFDLNNDTLDCNYIVNMNNLPDIPVHIYGSMDKSKTSIHAGKVILNTLGDITHGVVDILGGVVEGAWKIFR
ncbi:MAG: hypothetical protein LBV65_00035 [Desulfovibrio sp.]|jgi:AsmA protein|nr:hypothetical protein [Desulfovibrio sp.]